MATKPTAAELIAKARALSLAKEKDKLEAAKPVVKPTAPVDKPAVAPAAPVTTSELKEVNPSVTYIATPNQVIDMSNGEEFKFNAAGRYTTTNLKEQAKMNSLITRFPGFFAKERK